MDPLAYIITANALASAVVGLIIISRGLGRSYRWLTIYLIGQALLGVIGAPLHKYRNIYGVYYFAVGLFNWIVPVLAATEAYAKVMANHPGVERFGRRVMWGCLLVSGLIAILTVFMRTNPDFSLLLAAGFKAERYIKSGILVFWILLIAFLVWFPVSLTRNTVIHCFAFAAYFLITTTSVFIVSVLPDDNRLTFNVARAALVLCCLAAWALFLTKRGESIMVRVGHRWNRAEEAKLLAQLDAINSHLMSTSRVQ